MSIKDLIQSKLSGAHKQTEKLPSHEHVLRRFEDLPEDYTVFCDVDSEYGPIEFVIETSQGAVFLIQTGEAAGKINGNNKILFLDGAKDEETVPLVEKKAMWLRDFITHKTGRKVWVHAMLVFANSRFRPFEASHVNIVDCKHMLKFIDKHKADKGAHMSPGAVRSVQKLRPDFLK